jgi:hypothetical protein
MALTAAFYCCTEVAQAVVVMYDGMPGKNLILTAFIILDGKTRFTFD